MKVPKHVRLDAHAQNHFNIDHCTFFFTDVKVGLCWGFFLFCFV